MTEAYDTGRRDNMKPFTYRGFTFHLYRNELEYYDTIDGEFKMGSAWQVLIKQVTVDKLFLAEKGICSKKANKMLIFVRKNACDAPIRREVEEMNRDVVDKAYQVVLKQKVFRGSAVREEGSRVLAIKHWKRKHPATVIDDVKTLKKSTLSSLGRYRIFWHRRGDSW